MATDAQVSPAVGEVPAPRWETAPELDDTYDKEYKDKYPTISSESESGKGYAGHLNDMQKAQLFQLRSMLEAEGYKDRLDTLTMLRFLRARKWDVNLAKKMFVEFEEWRKKTLLDALVPTWNYKERVDLVQYYPQFYHKTDKDGRPVYIEKLGEINLTAMHQITTDQRMLDNLAVEYEKCEASRLPAASRSTKKLVETFCTIMDLKGVSLTKAGQVYAYVNQASVISQNYYPERLGKLYIINAPWGFSGVWSIVKGWLDPVTVKKIHILGSSYQKELLAQIPAENLPEEFGGTCRCPYIPNTSKDANEKEEKVKAANPCWFSDAGPWKEEDEIRKKQQAEQGKAFDDELLPWFERRKVIEDARKALQGTPKEVPLDNEGGETVGAEGQQTAAVAS